MTNITAATEKLLSDVLREIILTPEEFSVRVTGMSRSFTVYIQSNFPDHKKLIGGMRKHYLATVSIVKRIAAKHGLTADVAPIDFKGRAFEQPYKEFVARNDWPKDKILNLIQRLGEACFEYSSEVRLSVVDGPNGSTNVDMLVSQAEDANTVAEMLTSFRTLIRPIGKNNGRTIYFNIVADIPHEAQPANADGRFAKEIQR